MQHPGLHEFLDAGMPDADPHPHVLVVEMGRDGPQSVVAGIAATGLDLEFARQQIEFVVEDHDIARRELEESRRLAHGAAALVHVGIGLQEKDLGAVEVAIAGIPLEALAPGAKAVPRGDPLQRHEADVVAVPGILSPGISQPDE